jgi:dipeptidyl aminopeptidase/acylaminoacyl peptidase
MIQSATYTVAPNYRGATNYGEKFKTEIGGDYFRHGYDDITRISINTGTPRIHWLPQ